MPPAGEIFGVATAPVGVALGVAVGVGVEVGVGLGVEVGVGEGVGLGDGVGEGVGRGVAVGVGVGVPFGVGVGVDEPEVMVKMALPVLAWPSGFVTVTLCAPAEAPIVLRFRVTWVGSL